MPYQRPTLADLVIRIQADFVSRLNLVGAVLRRSVVAVLSRVFAGVAHGIYGYIEYLSRQFFAVNAEGTFLEDQAADYGLTRIAATYASGPVVITGTDAAVVQAGELMQRTDGVQFRTDSDATIVAGTATVNVTAVSSGAASNTDAGVVLSFVSPVTGIDSSATVDVGGIVDGNDQEGDEGLRARLLDRKQNPPHGGNANDYIQWAKTIAGVTRVWVYPNLYGPGTVGVTFVTDGTDPIIPTPAKVTEVQDYIDTVKPVTADVTVFAPTTLAVDFSISITPDTAAVRAAAEAELADLFTRLGEPGGVIFLSKINEAISIASGEDNHVLVSPAADVTPASTEIPILGTITWL